MKQVDCGKTEERISELTDICKAFVNAMDQDIQDVQRHRPLLKVLKRARALFLETETPKEKLSQTEGYMNIIMMRNKC